MRNRLAGEIDEDRGWGVEGETFNVFDRLVQIGGAEWFRLGDRDLATHLFRTRRRREGATLTGKRTASCTRRVSFT